MNDIVNNTTTSTVSTPTVAPQPAAQRSPGRFGRIFGSILGGAVNVIAPGAGSLIGTLVRGNGGMDMTSMETMMQQQAQQTMAVIGLQNRVQTQSQEFTTVSNLLKARHDSEMAAVNNFKS